MLEPQVKPKVLVVDDDDAIRTMVERVLQREKYHVDSARDGQEAIEKLNADRFDTVVLDLMMPRVDGHGVLRWLASAAHARPPRVIVMTAYVQHHREIEGTEPVFRVLPKPFELGELLTHLRESTLPEPLAIPESAAS